MRAVPFAALWFLCAVNYCWAQVQAQVQESHTVPWYENLPAVAMDYKVHIDPGKEDCYYQYVNPSATFYVSFQVIVKPFFVVQYKNNFKWF